MLTFWRFASLRSVTFQETLQGFDLQRYRPMKRCRETFQRNVRFVLRGVRRIGRGLRGTVRSGGGDDAEGGSVISARSVCGGTAVEGGGGPGIGAVGGMGLRGLSAGVCGAVGSGRDADIAEFSWQGVC